jgi:dTMP kinase
MSAPPPRFAFRRNPGPGRLITVEGLDGAGKTTIVADLCRRLAGRGIRVVSTRIPTDEMRASRFFEDLQRRGRTDLVNPLAFEVAYMADRIQHCHTVIEPALREGCWVVSDRYALSSIGSLLLRLPALRQVAVAALCDEAWFRQLSAELIAPDLALLLHARPETTIARLRARPDENDRNLDSSEYEVLQGVLAQSAEANDMVLVDTDGPPEATQAAVWELACALLGPACAPA